ncbi:DnaJ domain-containing protein [Microvirga tunisiensis]|uniref:DnaJ domain-containing protein n=2 Tax=Pannonibacter tanglangensis TaxID=2750084 RepID=A0A7X5F5Z9_9HYPH|nr:MULTISPECIES: J domain-containing protein [unclassified Pannonibacter]NBN65875.1 DnaJ domain-containing protein [Pannonibacter sp. XCT-34]NBN80393.1 DnaJ domain-containing protein [Pannonibacter sp. XCT-53]
MKLDSKLFDRIRVKPDRDRLDEDDFPPCQHPGCTRPGTHKAPQGRDREGKYFFFCIDHVRDYNKSYNYFTGMDDDAVRMYQKDALTGHRPTWRMGVNREAAQGPDGIDPRAAGRARAYARHGGTPQARDRKLLALEKRSFDVLNLSERARGDEIKARYKELVKLHHPDANGGDRSSEDRLRQIIQAYNVLKKAGFC